MEGVDHGLGLVEADGVGGDGVQDGGKGLLDSFWSFDVREYLRIKVGIAGGAGCVSLADGWGGGSSSSPGRAWRGCRTGDRRA